MTAPPLPAMPDPSADMKQICRAIESMGALLTSIMERFPAGDDESVSPELLRTNTKLAIIQCGNALEYAVDLLRHEHAWARAKLLSWCAKEAEWEALNLT